MSSVTSRNALVALKFETKIDRSQSQAEYHSVLYYAANETKLLVSFGIIQKHSEKV